MWFTILWLVELSIIAVSIFTDWELNKIMTSTEVDVNLLSDFGQTQKCGTINEVYS
jgi:hypothetical protein